MEHDIELIGDRALAAALRLRDLSDPQQGRHAMQLVVADLVRALKRRWRCRAVVHRATPVVTVADNYDRLHYPPDGVARQVRHTRYVTPSTVLRTHMTASIPPLLRALAGADVTDVLLACPGMVYRRDCIDRLHTGEPHQLDLWRLRRGKRLCEQDLSGMVETMVRTALPEALDWRWVRTEHPYTEHGRELEVRVDGRWIEIGECGVASSRLLAEAGLGAEVSGLAMGLGLDRIVMVRKDMDDIRLLRSEDPRTVAQLGDLTPYRRVSTQPEVKRDLSLAVCTTADAEALGDRTRTALGADAACIEELVILSETAYSELPPAAIERLGMDPSQKNVLLRLVIRHPDRTLTGRGANELRDRVYVALHEGTRREMTGM